MSRSPRDRAWKVGVFGAGHVGLPTAAAITHLGHEVVVYDSDEEKITGLQGGRLPFFEPGLDELVREASQAGKLTFSSSPAAAVTGSKVVFICVGTPPGASGEANLAALERAAEAVARHATSDVVVVQKSTVPTGTASRLEELMGGVNGSVRFDVVSNPEFLRQGRAVEDSLRPDRILVGGRSQQALATLRDLYAPLVESGTRWIEGDVATAEMAKHAANAFLAMKISFVNALARLCEAAGADVVSVADAIGSDPRIGRAFLDAGLGYGGYCLPKDIAAFERVAHGLGYDFPLLREVARLNQEALDATFAKVERELGTVHGKRIALLGLSFKPGTDDTRLSPALALANRLLQAGAELVGYDPHASAAAKGEVPQLEIAADVYAALEGAHCAVVCTDWPEFAELDLNRSRDLMARPVIVDGRNVFEPAEMGGSGFTYLPSGRPAVRPDRPGPASEQRLQ